MYQIDRRRFLSRLAGSSSALLLSSLATGIQAGKTSRKPNIVFILIDDLGWKDLSCYGSKLYETPAIDQLAKEGVRFTQAYCAHPRCVPSRVAIYSGKYPARCGSPGKSGKLKNSEVTFAEVLQDTGYETFFAGKWHLGRENNEKFPYPQDQGFDVNVAGCSIGAPGSYFYPYQGTRKNRAKQTLVVDVPGLEGGNEGEYLTDRLTTETVKFIRKQKDSPFLAVLSHYAVHTPLQAKEELVDKYEQKIKKMPEPEGPAYIKEGVGETKMFQDHPVYAGMIQSVDESVAKIRKTLDDLSLSDNTIIILTSDNGGLSNRGDRRYLGARELATSNIPLRAGKGWCYEGGIRVPLIVKWPGVTKAGSESNAIITGTDYYPTILELTGQPLKPEQHMDGISFKKVLTREKSSTRRQAFWHSPLGRPDSTGDENCTVIRDGDYKLIDWYDQQRVELYNINNDFKEQNDLSRELPEKTKELAEKVKAWRLKVNAVIKK